MTALAYALALASQQPAAPPPPWYRPWPRYADAHVHVGGRIAGYLDNEGDGGALEVGAGLTVQVTADWPALL